MLVVETIAKIRRAYFVQQKPIKVICRELRVSRKVVRKVVRSEATSFHYERAHQPRPKLGPWQDELEQQLSANESKPIRDRLTLIRIFEELREQGFEGGYDTVRRYAKNWRRKQAFAFFKGACTRGIYDNMKTAVDTIFVGKERAYNRRFQQMCSHFLVEPIACTPAAGWEKGQVEKQVGTARGRFPACSRIAAKVGPVMPGLRSCAPADRDFFIPRLRAKSLDELNAWLMDKCLAHAKAHAHPEFKERTVWQVFETERPSLVPYAGRFPACSRIAAKVGPVMPGLRRFAPADRDFDGFHG